MMEKPTIIIKLRKFLNNGLKWNEMECNGM